MFRLAPPARSLPPLRDGPGGPSGRWKGLRNQGRAVSAAVAPGQRGCPAQRSRRLRAFAASEFFGRGGGMGRRCAGGTMCMTPARLVPEPLVAIKSATRIIICCCRRLVLYPHAFRCGSLGPWLSLNVRVWARSSEHRNIRFHVQQGRVGGLRSLLSLPPLSLFRRPLGLKPFWASPSPFHSHPGPQALGAARYGPPLRGRHKVHDACATRPEPLVAKKCDAHRNPLPPSPRLIPTPFGVVFSAPGSH